MNVQDTDSFTHLLTATMDAYGKECKPNTVDFWLSLLEAIPFNEIMAAFKEYLKDPAKAPFPPKPGDIIGIIQSKDGRPGVEEAWALIPKTDAATVCWTDEMAAAWGIAEPLMEIGNETAARMTFKEVYAKHLKVARSAGTPTQWSASLGEDAVGRAAAVIAARDAGRIPDAYAATLMDAPAVSQAPRLSGANGLGNGVTKVLEHLARTNRDNSVAKRELGRIRKLLGMPGKGLANEPPPRQLIHPVRDTETVAAAMEAMWSQYPAGKAERDVVEAHVDADLDMLLADDRANGEFPRGDIEFYRAHAEHEYNRKQEKKLS